MPERGLIPTPWSLRGRTRRCRRRLGHELHPREVVEICVGDQRRDGVHAGGRLRKGGSPGEASGAVSDPHDDGADRHRFRESRAADLAGDGRREAGLEIVDHVVRERVDPLAEFVTPARRNRLRLVNCLSFSSRHSRPSFR